MVERFKRYSNLKNQAISVILPNFAPNFRGELSEDREKIVHINPKEHFKSYSNMKSDFL